MGKHEPFSPKAIANKIKAKGLQKLRWYCQMCQKQCRDENGFKCHCLSESHKRQMLIFAENPHKFMDQYSKEFEHGYLTILRSRHSTSRVNANHVYTEYISDRNHTHMNSTMWTSLSEFVKYLGRTGKCTVEDTEKGWFISYIDRDPESVARQLAKEQKEKLELDEEERNKRMIEKQIQEALKSTPLEIQQESVPSELEMDRKEKIVFSLGSNKSQPKTSTSNENTDKNTPIIETKPEDSNDTSSVSTNSIASSSVVSSSSLPTSSTSSAPTSSSSGFKLSFVPPKEIKNDNNNNISNNSSDKSSGGKRKLNAFESLIKEQEEKKEKQNRKDYWLAAGIVVKIIDKKLGDGKFYNQKALVTEVIDKYSGKVEVIETGHIIEIDQVGLETVIPQVGGNVKILNGAYRGSVGKLEFIDVNNYCASVEITEGANTGKIVKLPYEDFSKFIGKNY